MAWRLLLLIFCSALKSVVLQESTIGISDGPDFTNLSLDQLKCLYNEFPGFYAAAVGFDLQYKRVREALHLAIKAGYRRVEVIFDPTNDSNATAQIDTIAKGLRDVCQLSRVWISVNRESKHNWHNCVDDNIQFIDELVAAGYRHSKLWSDRECIAFELGIRTNEVEWERITGNSDWLKQKRMAQGGANVELWYMFHGSGTEFTRFGGWSKQLRNIHYSDELTDSTCKIDTHGVFKAAELPWWISGTARISGTAPPGNEKHLADKFALQSAPAVPHHFILGFLRAREHLLSADRHMLASSGRFSDWQNFLIQPPVTPAEKVLLVSASFNSRPTGKLTRPHVERYAKTNGYELLYFDQAANEVYTPPWQKLFFLQAAMAHASRPDVIFWIDDDLVITNTSVRVENFLRLASPKFLHMVVTQDVLFAPHSLFNNGVMIFRNCPLMQRFLEKVLKGYDEIPYYRLHGSYEQDVMNLVVYEMPDLYRHTLVLPHCLQQSFDASWQVGDFIMHTPGLREFEKVASLEFLLNNPIENWSAFPRFRLPGIWACDRSY